MIIRLSYPLSVTSPSYPGTPPLTVHRNKSLEKGDSSNTSVVSLSSHTGTHIDAPSHFCPDGRSVYDLLNLENIYYPAYCLDIQKGRDECISCSDFHSFTSPCSDARALLIRTGWSQYRAIDPQIYTHENPWVNEDIPEFLRINFPNLQVFGLDTISISNVNHRETGRACHRAFLCKNPSILLLEDVDLSNQSLSQNKFSLMIFPWMLEKIDGVPILLLAEKTNRV